MLRPEVDRLVTRQRVTILSLALFVACGTDATGPARVSMVSIAPPPSAVLTIGDSILLTALVRDAGGNVLNGHVVTWTSSDAATATVRPTGAGPAAMVKAMKSGTAIVTAVSEGKSGTTGLTVSEPIASVVVSLSVSTLTVGERALLIVSLRDANNNELPRRPMTYASANTAVATVASTGIVSAGAPGTAELSATWNGKSGVATITVLAPPTQHAFLWTATDGMKDLGVPPGFASSQGLAINAAGQVAGSASNGEAPSPVQTHAVLWSPAGDPRDLGTLPEGGNSSATAINGVGQVVGYAGTGSFFRAVLWSPTGLIRDLGTLPGDRFSYATGVNDVGQVVGLSGRDGRVRAFVWTEAGGMVDPLQSVTPPVIAISANANAINRAGVVAGFAGSNAFRLSAANAFQALKPLAGDSTAVAFAINDAGDAVGNSSVVVPDYYYYDYYLPHAVLWTAAGGTVNLSVVAGCSNAPCEAFGLNNRGQVVGYIGLHAFVWTQAGGLLDIGVLPRRNTSAARGVNDAGQIVGYSR